MADVKIYCAFGKTAKYALFLFNLWRRNGHLCALTNTGESPPAQVQRRGAFIAPPPFDKN
jgi:hypothetical protein